MPQEWWTAAADRGELSPSCLTIQPPADVGSAARQGSGRLLQAGVILLPFLLQLACHLLKMLKRDPRSNPCPLLGV